MRSIAIEYLAIIGARRLDRGMPSQFEPSFKVLGVIRTPLLDIKPYNPKADQPDAAWAIRGGWTDEFSNEKAERRMQCLDGGLL